MKKRAFWLIPVLLIVLYLVGPTPQEPDFDNELPQVPDLEELSIWIAEKEGKLPVKPDNEARIIWADSIPSKTKYAIVYLHGFSASQSEGNPIHRKIASRFGCNLYLSRLQSHGLEAEEPLLDYSPEGAWNSAKEALAIGQKLGETVILISTSTGGTLSLMLGARFENIAAHILFSPNIEINDPAAPLLNNPWGLQIAELVLGGKYRDIDYGPEYARYWNDHYRIESLVALQELLEASMNMETFMQVKQPLFLGYYYKDEQNQDPVVKVEAMLRMFRQLGTSEEMKRKEAFPNVGNHVIASPIKSKDINTVYQSTVRFLEEVLALEPRSNP